MKVRTVFLLLAITLYNSFSTNVYAQQGGDSWASIKAKKAGKIACIYYPTPGIVYKENGQMKGVCVDLLDEFSDFVEQKYGVDLAYEFVQEENNFSKFINTVRNSKNLVGVCNTSITRERDRFLDFSPPYMNNPSVLLSNGSASSIKELSEIKSAFSNYTAVVIAGSTHEKYLEEIKGKYYPSLKVKKVNSGVAVNNLLAGQENYFTLIDFTEYFDALRNKLKVTRHPVDLSALEDQLGYIFPEGSDWTAVWEEFLTNDYKQSVAYKKIIADNFGSSFLNLIR